MWKKSVRRTFCPLQMLSRSGIAHAHELVPTATSHDDAREACSNPAARQFPILDSESSIR